MAGPNTLLPFPDANMRDAEEAIDVAALMQGFPMPQAPAMQPFEPPQYDEEIVKDSMRKKAAGSLIGLALTALGSGITGAAGGGKMGALSFATGGARGWEDAVSQIGPWGEREQARLDRQAETKATVSNQNIAAKNQRSVAQYSAEVKSTQDAINRAYKELSTQRDLQFKAGKEKLKYKTEQDKIAAQNKRWADKLKSLEDIAAQNRKNQLKIAQTTSGPGYQREARLKVEQQWEQEDRDFLKTGYDVNTPPESAEALYVRFRQAATGKGYTEANFKEGFIKGAADSGLVDRMMNEIEGQTRVRPLHEKVAWAEQNLVPMFDFDMKEATAATTPEDKAKQEAIAAQKEEQRQWNTRHDDIFKASSKYMEQGNEPYAAFLTNLEFGRVDKSNESVKKVLRGLTAMRNGNKGEAKNILKELEASSEPAKDKLIAVLQAAISNQEMVKRTWAGVSSEKPKSE